MKNFKDYAAEKYSEAGYEKVEEGIYKTKIHMAQKCVM